MKDQQVTLWLVIFYYNVLRNFPFKHFQDKVILILYHIVYFFLEMLCAFSSCVTFPIFPFDLYLGTI